MKTIIHVSMLALCMAVSAAHASDSETTTPYRYGHQLDIAKVISASDGTNLCGISPARMTYEDTQGQQHVLEYMVWGSGCGNDN
ncbi:DUF2790 domain-containing protein [Pseudomonas sp. Marseille-Q8238]